MTSARSAQPSLRLQRWQYNVAITAASPFTLCQWTGKGDRLYIWITFVTEIIKLDNNKRDKKLQKLKNIVTRRGHVTRVITRSIDTCHNEATWHVSASANLPMMWKSPSSWFALIAASRPRTVRPSQKQTTTLYRVISRYSILSIQQNLCGVKEIYVCQQI